MFGREKRKKAERDNKRPIESRDYFVIQPVDDPAAHEVAQLAVGVTVAYKDGVLIVGRPAKAETDVNHAKPASSEA
jgi:hypothetical protein